MRRWPPPRPPWRWTRFDEDAPVGRALALVSLGRPEEATAGRAPQARPSPDDASAHTLAGPTSMATGDHDAASASLREAQQLDPTEDWLRDFGLIGLGGVVRDGPQLATHANADGVYDDVLAWLAQRH